LHQGHAPSDSWPRRGMNKRSRLRSRSALLHASCHRVPTPVGCASKRSGIKS
jgi:hypothetical protein